VPLSAQAVLISSDMLIDLHFGVFTDGSVNMTELPNLKHGDVAIRLFASGKKQLVRIRAVNDGTVYIKSGLYTHRFDSSTGNGITHKSQRIYVDAGEIVSMQMHRAARGKGKP